PPFCHTDHAAPRALHSFPTRRSSDLVGLDSLNTALGEYVRGVGKNRQCEQQIVRDDRHHDVQLELPRLRRGRDRDVVTEHLIAQDRKSTRLNSSHVSISYAVFCLKKK